MFPYLERTIPQSSNFDVDNHKDSRMAEIISTYYGLDCAYNLSISNRNVLDRCMEIKKNN